MCYVAYICTMVTPKTTNPRSSVVCIIIKVGFILFTVANVFTAASAESTDTSDIVAYYETGGTTAAITRAVCDKACASLERYAPSLAQECTPEEKQRFALSHAIALATLDTTATDAKISEALQHDMAQEYRKRLISHYHKKIVNQVPPPDDLEIENLYKQNMGHFSAGGKIRARMIIAYCGDTADKTKMAQARKRIDEAALRLSAGDRFETVACELSNMPMEDPRGNAAEFEESKLQPRVAETIAKLKPGGVSEPFEFGHGYMILRLEERVTTSVQPLDDSLRKRISDMALAETRAKYWSKYMESLRSIIPVVIHPIAPDCASSGVIALEIGGIKYTAEQLAADMRKYERMLASSKERPVVELTKQYADLELIVRAAEDMGLNKSDIFISELDEFHREQGLGWKISAILENSTTTPTEQELMDYHQAHPDTFRSKKETRISLIDIRADTGTTSSAPTDREMANAYWRAQQACASLKRGEAFEDVQKRCGGGEGDGILNYAPTGPRGHVIDMAVEKLLKPGETSTPVPHRKGFYVITLLDARESEPLAFDSATTMVRQALLGEKKLGLLRMIYEQIAREHKLIVVNKQTLF